MYSPHIAAMASSQRMRNQVMDELWLLRVHSDFGEVNRCIFIKTGPRRTIPRYVLCSARRRARP